MNTILVLVALLCVSAVVVESQLGNFRKRKRGRFGRKRKGGNFDRKVCDYASFRNDALGLYYWKESEDLCTDKYCKQFPELNCDVTDEFLMEQAIGHTEDDIPKEIAILQKYFDTLLPALPANDLPYGCKGLCACKQKRVKNMFVSIPSWDHVKQDYADVRHMCHVIGPNLWHADCSGNCYQDKSGYTDPKHQCLPDTFVTIDAWLYCPKATPSCQKYEGYRVPIGCTCKTLKCLKSTPKYKKKLPLFPPGIESQLTQEMKDQFVQWDPIIDHKPQIV